MRKLTALFLICTLLFLSTQTAASQSSGSNTITITKSVNWNGNPANAGQPFTITIAGPSFPTPGQISLVDGQSQTLSALANGAYTITETTPGSGWFITYTVNSLLAGHTNALVNLSNPFAPSPVPPGALSGRVYRDYTSDGQITSSGGVTDAGLPGVIVTAYNSTGTPCGSATTNSTGNYSFTPSCTGPWRLITSDLPSSYEPSTHGSANSTTVQMITSAPATTNIAVNRPLDYCPANVNLAAPLSVAGPYNANIGGATNFTSRAALVRFPLSASGKTGDATYVAPTAIATHAQIGSTFGLAYQRSTKTTFVSAFQKRGVGLGPGGPGAIYRIDSQNNVTLHATIPSPGTGTHDFAGSYTTTTYDQASIPEVSRASLGDLEIDNNGQQLYTINLANQHLYSIAADASATITDLGQVTGPADCPAIDFRPFGLGIDSTNTLYIGAVCSNQSNTATSGRPSALILRYDGSASFSEVLRFSLNFGNLNNNTNYPYWSNWTDTLRADKAEPVLGNVMQPLLTDLVFEGQNLVMAFRSRGYDIAYYPAGNIAPIGDILKACWNGTGWALENNAVCGSNTGALPNSNQTPPGPGGGLFYDIRDFFNSMDSAGALAITPGRNILANIVDPRQAFSAGIQQLHPTTGARSLPYEVYYGSPNNAGTLGYMGKTNGIGDIELLCDPAPIEIGNRVWNDINANGRQDPGEPGLAALQVSLLGPTTTLQTTTDANGLYYFNNLSANTAYTLTVSAPAGYLPTTPNAWALTGASATSNHPISDTIDSDAISISSPIGGGQEGAIYYTTGNAGQNNHGLDFGFTQPVNAQVQIANLAPSPTPTATDTPTPTATDTPTPTATDTPTPTATDTPTPTATLAVEPPIATNTPIARYDLRVALSHDTVPPARIDDPITFTVQLTNTGQTSLITLPITGTYDTRYLAFRSANPPPTDLTDDGTLNWPNLTTAFGFIAPQQAITVTVTFAAFNDTTALPSGKTTFSASSSQAISLDGNLISPPATSAGGITIYRNTAILGTPTPIPTPIPNQVSIGDYAWNDRNLNGLQDQGEPPLPNIEVALFVLDPTTGQPRPAVDLNNQLVLPQRTAANGHYRFTNLPAGRYQVAFQFITLPAGYHATAPNIGHNSTIDSDAIPTGPTLGFTDPTAQLVAGQQDLDLDFGAYLPVLLQCRAWYDYNANGLQDANEPAVPGVRITLLGALSLQPITDRTGLPITTTTDRTGQAHLPDLPPGNYRLQFDLATLPAGFIPTQLHQGPPDNDNDTQQNGITTATGYLAPGENNLHLDLGIATPTAINEEPERPIYRHFLPGIHQ